MALRQDFLRPSVGILRVAIFLSLFFVLVQGLEVRAQDTTQTGPPNTTQTGPGIVPHPGNTGTGTPHITVEHPDLLNPSIAQIAPGCGFGDWSFESTGTNVWTPAGNAFQGKCPVKGETLRARDAHPDMELAAGGIGGDYWRDLTYRIGIKGQNWVTSAGAGLTGSLTSQVLGSAHRYVSFLMGGSASQKIYVALQMQRNDVDALLQGSWPGRPPGQAVTENPNDFVEIGRISNSEDGQDLKRYRFDVAALLNIDPEVLSTQPLLLYLHPPRIRVVIVDGDSSASGGFINVDDFRFQDTPPQVIEAMHGTIRVDFDPDHPVWGFADTHTHPAAHLGFGGLLIVGDPSQPLDQTYATAVCQYYHGGGVAAMGDKSWLSFNVVASGNSHYCWGAPDYIGFPRFNVKLYSGYHPDFFRRAWQGGGRLIVALVVNQQYLASRNGIKPGTPTDDDSQAKLQIDFITKLAAANSDFMEIAKTARDARRIILEGKLAVVLGLELDTFGNFKDPTWVWKDDTSNGTQPLVTLSSDKATAKTQINDAIEHYYGSGVRQVTAIHYIDGLFGGVPVMQPEPMIISTNGYTGHCYSLTEGTSSTVARNILRDYNDFNLFAESVALEGVTTEQAAEAFMRDCATRNLGFGDPVSTINRQGLTDAGTELFTGLMRKGMVVDSEHTSFATKDGLIALANRYHYPLMSSHTDPTTLAFRPQIWPSSGSDPNAWQNLSAQDRWSRYGTSTPANLANEFSARDSDLDVIRDSGGTVGLFLVPWRKPDYMGHWRADSSSGLVRNNNDGSTKSWAQAFLYTAERMNGHGVALASDRAGIESVAPRFGVFSAWGLTSDKEPFADGNALRLGRRSAQSLSSDPQVPWGATSARDVRASKIDKGVHYDVPIKSFHSWLYEWGVEDPFEEDVWKARAFITAHPDVDPASTSYASLGVEGNVGATNGMRGAPPDTPQQVPQSSDAAHVGRIENFVRGWHATSVDKLVKPGIGVGDGAYEQAVFYAIRHNISACDLADSMFGFNKRDIGTICYGGQIDLTGNFPYEGPLYKDYATAKMVFDLWQAMDGDNAPLRRYVTGTRYWDFNLDGLANYGLLPDFLQDLRNVGINAAQMDALFESAEDYIEMWEKSEAASARVPKLPVNIARPPPISR